MRATIPATFNGKKLTRLVLAAISLSKDWNAAVRVYPTVLSGWTVRDFYDCRRMVLAALEYAEAK